MPRAGCTSQSRASAQARGARTRGPVPRFRRGGGVAVGNHSSGPFGGSHPRPAFCAPTGAHPGEAIAWCLGTGAWTSEVGRLRPPWGATLSPGGGHAPRTFALFSQKCGRRGRLGRSGSRSHGRPRPGPAARDPRSFRPPRREGTCQQRKGFVGLGSLQHRARQAGTRAPRRRQLPSGPPHQTPKTPRGPRPLSPEPCPRSRPAAGLTHSPVPPQH